MKVLAFDPGGTTGIAFLNWKSTENYKVQSSELGPQEHHVELWNLLHRMKPEAIVCESFDYRVKSSKGTKMPGINLISRNYIGIIELYCELNDVPLYMQSPSQGGGGYKHSGFWKNDKLKKLDLYKAPEGRQHMADALRHLLYWFSFIKKNDYFVRKLK